MQNLSLCLSLLTALTGAAAAASPTLAPEVVNAAHAWNAPPSAALILRTQILLDRAHFAPGEIDAAAGAKLRKAIAAFQRQQELDSTGAMDDATWDALNRDSAPALVPYEIQAADLAGPFEPVPPAMLDKAALPYLGYATALEGLAEKFHASPALLRRLNPGKDLEQEGASIVVPNVLDSAPLPRAGRIVVDRSDSVLALYDAQGRLMAQFPASTGSEHDPLPLGMWKVKGISVNPIYHYNPKLFWDADPNDQRVQLAPGPNNPVGVAWIQLSKPHYGIHGTPEPAQIGRTQSHGCIRLSNWDVATVIKSVGAGTDVELQE